MAELVSLLTNTNHEIDRTWYVLGMSLRTFMSLTVAKAVLFQKWFATNENREILYNPIILAFISRVSCQFTRTLRCQ